MQYLFFHSPLIHSNIKGASCTYIIQHNFLQLLLFLSESGGEQASGRTAVAVAGPTPVAVSTAANSSASGPRECAGCGKRITERFLLKALDLFWHEDCLKCGCCDCRLGEVGSTLYTKANLILCKRDYLRLVIINKHLFYPIITKFKVYDICFKWTVYIINLAILVS